LRRASGRYPLSRKRVRYWSGWRRWNTAAEDEGPAASTDVEDWTVVAIVVDGSDGERRGKVVSVDVRGRWTQLSNLHSSLVVLVILLPLGGVPWMEGLKHPSLVS
jgi:hypothetical protein